MAMAMAGSFRLAARSYKQGHQRVLMKRHAVWWPIGLKDGMAATLSFLLSPVLLSQPPSQRCQRDRSRFANRGQGDDAASVRCAAGHVDGASGLPAQDLLLRHRARRSHDR